MDSLSVLLKSKREEKKMGLRDFANLLGISHAYLDKLEKGRDPRTGKEIKPTIDTLNKIATALNIPANDFFSVCGYENIPGTEYVDIKDYIDRLRTIEGLMFNGMPIEPEARESVMQALLKGMEQVDELLKG